MFGHLESHVGRCTLMAQVSCLLHFSLKFLQFHSQPTATVKYWNWSNLENDFHNLKYVQVFNALTQFWLRTQTKCILCGRIVGLWNLKIDLHLLTLWKHWINFERINHHIKFHNSIKKYSDKPITHSRLETIFITQVLRFPSLWLVAFQCYPNTSYNK